MTVKDRILQAAAGMVAESADGEISTRAVCDAAGVTAPTLYHHFGDKQGLLAAVVDFGLAAFLESKRAAAAVVHEHVADSIRVGWDNHLEFARENASVYKLMWAPGGAAAKHAAVAEAFGTLKERLEHGAGKGQLRVSAEAGTRMILSAVTGAALTAIYQPELFDDPSYALQLREAVIAAVTVPSKQNDQRAQTVAGTAATLKSRLSVEGSSLNAPEQALLEHWLTTLADAPAPATPPQAAPQGLGCSRPPRAL